MEGVMSQAFRFLGSIRKAESKVKTETDLQNQQLIDDISDVKMRLDSAHCRFDYALEEDLVESIIYEIESLESRYGYLLKQAKTRGILCSNQ